MYEVRRSCTRYSVCSGKWFSTCYLFDIALSWRSPGLMTLSLSSSGGGSEMLRQPKAEFLTDCFFPTSHMV